MSSDGDVRRYTLGELREAAEAWYEHRASDHAPGTVSVDRVKVGKFLDWLEGRDA